MPSRFLALLFAAGFLPAGLAADWPEFRGPTGQGHADGEVPIEWGPDKNVAWKREMPGKGWSSPVVAGGRVYLTTAVPGPDDNALSLRVLCLNAAGGSTVWDREVFHPARDKSPRIHAKNSHASPTPVFHGGRVYAHFGHQGTVCLDSDGSVIWRSEELTYAPVHGNGGSPVVVDDLLVFSCDGGDRRFVAALELATGKVRWKTPRSWGVDRGFSFSTPLLMTAGGRRQVVSPGSGGVAAYDPATGKELWRVRYDGYSVIPRPVFGHGLVFVCTGYNTPSLLAIRPDGSGDVTETHVAWSTRKNVPHTPSPLLVGDDLYLVSDAGTASCLDAKTGRVHWQQRLGGNFSASPLSASGRIYFQNEEGAATVARAGHAFEAVARNALRERTLASYAASEGALYLRTEKQLYRFVAR